MTKDEYYGTYLGMDEGTCATALLARRDGTCDQATHTRIIERKAVLFRDHTATQKAAMFPWVTGFVKQAAGQYRLAIASGGWSEQIRSTLAGDPIEAAFELIISADDCAVGKPDPAVYECALRQLNARRPKQPLLRASECLVIEDSVRGFRRD
ncbi:MAG: HAD family hydrolase [Nitrospira sp.]